MKVSKPETHPDFLVSLENGGIKLIKPGSEHHDGLKLKRLTIRELFQLGLHVYFLNENSIIRGINEETVKNCGFYSIKNALNKSVRSLAAPQTAEQSILHDREVLQINKIIVRDESYTKRNEDGNFHAVSIKYPWRNEEDKIIGIFGCSFVPTIHGVSEPIQTLVNNNLFESTRSSEYFTQASLNEKNGMPALSSREMQCLHYLIRGNTAKMTASKMNISVRTAEHYIENIKIKFQVNSKYELINKALEWGFNEIYL